MSRSKEKMIRLIHDISDIGGSGAGVVLGTVAGGPVGAVGGAMVGSALSSVLKDLCDRMLSEHEQARVEATGVYALHYIRRHLENGEVPVDEFFSNKDAGISTVEEIFEGALLKAKNDHEDRKSQFYGKLFANIAFDSQCSRAEANYLLHLMDKLTFLQLVLINIFSERSRYPSLPATPYDGEQISPELLNALSATYELYQNGILRMEVPNDDSPSRPFMIRNQNGQFIFDMAEICPSRMRLSDSGSRFCNLSGLNEMNAFELENVVGIFSSVQAGK